MPSKFEHGTRLLKLTTHNSQTHPPRRINATAPSPITLFGWAKSQPISFFRLGYSAAAVRLVDCSRSSLQQPCSCYRTRQPGRCTAAAGWTGSSPEQSNEGQPNAVYSSCDVAPRVAKTALASKQRKDALLLAGVQGCKGKTVFCTCPAAAYVAPGRSHFTRLLP